MSTNADTAVTTLAYDIRGRKISMTDPDMGTWQYRYNIFGELIWQKDAKGNITTLSYDSLGRLVSRVELEGTTSWTYDTSPTKGKGKLHSVTSPGGYSETHTYDSLGRPSTMSRTISGSAYSITQTYDTVGRPRDTVYPTGFTTRNVYNSYGFLKEVRRVDGIWNQVYWMAQSYSATGRIDGELYGNGLVNDRFYSNATGRLQLATVGKGIETAAPWSIQHLQYDYDAMGNVASRTEGTTGRYESFTYDGLDRLKTHAITGGATVSVNYAVNGNITSKSDVGNYAYGSSRPHALTGVSGGALGTQSYTYDANGNMTAGGGRSITWSSFNQVQHVEKTPAIYSTFYFGANHERVRQVSHLGTTVYVGALYEKVTSPGGTLTEHKHYIMGPTGRIAVHTSNSSNSNWDLSFFHTDGLGSITAVSNQAGAIVKRFAYDAWGKRLDPATGNAITGASSGGYSRGYTDHEQLDDLGLIHMNGRVYDPVLGRFMSADPNVDGVSDAQGYNRYSYVGNNPMNATDPSGYFKLKDLFSLKGVFMASHYANPLYHAAPKFYKQTAGQVNGIAVAAIITYASGGTLATLAGAVGGFISGFESSLLNGASVGDAFKSGMIGAGIGAVTGWASGQIGAAFNGIDASAGSTLGRVASWGGRAVSHGLVGGAASELQGGEFRHGFYSSAFSTGFMHAKGVRALMGGVKGGAWIAARTATAAVVGGTASVLSGGKFANGAVTSAFQHLFNYESSASATRAAAIEKIREQIALAAEHNIDSRAWSHGRMKGKFGFFDPKCNLFVLDMIVAGGAPDLTNAKGWPPTAGAWGDPKIEIAGWEIVDGPVQRGDVLAIKHQTAQATGHVGIVVGGSLTVSAASAGNGNRVVRNDWGFRAGEDQIRVVRRFIGKDE